MGGGEEEAADALEGRVDVYWPWRVEKTGSQRYLLRFVFSYCS